MIKFKIDTRPRIVLNQCVEGEPLEHKVARVLTSGEPIKDGAPIIYTPRAEGVAPQYNVRTDRFDVALDATDKIAKSYLARRDEKAEMTAQKGGGNDVGNESSEGGTKAGNE